VRRFSSFPILLLRCPSGEVVEAWVATTFGSRLLGLAVVGELPRGRALLIPRCRSIHTLGMRFAIDVVFLRRSVAVEVRAHVGPGQLVRSPKTAGVSALEIGAGEAERLGLAPGRPLPQQARRAAGSGGPEPSL